ncbi:MAG: hypothetical protein AAGI46_13235 [Planctomycetota bacterium]
MPLSSTIRLAPLAAGGGLAVFGGVLLLIGLVSGGGEGKLDYQIDVKPTVMTVAYKAYGNPEAADGKYWLGKVELENDGDASLDNLEVSYRIPGHLDSWTTPEAAEQLLPGQTASLAIYPQLPRSVTTIRTRTPATLEVKLAWEQDGETQEQIERRNFEFRGVNEIEYTSLPADEVLGWYDVYDNAELTAAFVTYEDAVVRQFFGKAVELGGAGAPVVSDLKSLEKMARSVYDFMTKSGMTYAGNTGVPEKIGDAAAYTQSVRLPRDVIYQNSGLCIELAMLWAALAKGAGAEAYLVLVPGHCYPVLKASDGSLLPIESTGVGGTNLGGVMSFEQAVQSGVKQFRELQAGKNPGIIVNVTQEQSRGVRPPEFGQTDIAGLNDMLTKRVQTARNDPRPNPNPNPGPNPNPNPNPQNIGGNVVNIAGLQMSYPMGFQQNPVAVQQIQPYLPSYVFNAMDQTGMRSIEGYDFGQSSPQQAIGQIQGFAQQMGAMIQFGQPQQQQVGSGQATFAQLQVSNGQFMLVGGMYFIQSPQGNLVGIAATSPQGDNSWQQTLATLVGGR